MSKSTKIVIGALAVSAVIGLLLVGSLALTA